MLDAILAEPQCCLKCQQPLTGQQWLFVLDIETLPECDACLAKRKRADISRRWCQRHPEQRRQIKKQWGAKNREKINALARAARQREPGRFAGYDRKRYPVRREEKIRAFNVYYNQRRAVDPDFRLKEAMASQIYNALRANKAGRTWETLVGYTLQELKSHLEARFLPGMSWENYGAWHIDHIRPRASFTFTSPEDEGFKQCWALDNLQPLWAADNIRKGHKWSG